VDRQIVALLCRTADRGPEAAEGAREVAELLDARIIGTPPAGESDARWDEDLRESRGCLLEAGGQVDDALADGKVPILLAGDCAVAISTLPVVMRHEPDARILWLDAHGDFNTPETTTSGYLGGMCLAGACGLWDTGFGDPVDPARVVMHGVRDLEGPERVALDTRGVHRITGPEPLAGLPVYVHVDLDVLDPRAMPARFPATGGMSARALRVFLTEVARTCRVVGAEVTSAAPGSGEVAADAIAPLLV
jgi:arginase family enzyme